MNDTKSVQKLIPNKISWNYVLFSSSNMLEIRQFILTIFLKHNEAVELF